MTSLVQKKFGEAAADYAASAVHATGPSLARLLELVETKPTWRMLDIATGAGHTALAFAPKLAKVTASDITPEMLQQARKLAKERGLSNVVTAQAPLLGELARLLQHLRGDVGCGDLGEFRREGERGVSGAGGDIEHAPSRLGLDELQEPRERWPGGMHGRRRIIGGGLTEFLLDQGCHRCFSGMTTTAAKASRGCRRSARQSRRPPPFAATPDGCGRACLAVLRNCGSRSRRSARPGPACRGSWPGTWSSPARATRSPRP